MLAHRLRTVADRLLDTAGDALDQHPRLARWRDERFYAQVEQRLPVIGVNAAHGTRYFVHPRDPYIGGGIMRTGVFQPENVTAALAVLRNDGQEIAQLLDIGANIGTGTTTIEILRQMPAWSASRLSQAQQTLSCCE